MIRKKAPKASPIPESVPMSEIAPVKNAQELLGTISDENPSLITTPIMYTKSLWGGVLSNFKCMTCGTFIQDEELMILHVIKHYPENQQDAILTKLIYDKEHAG